MTTDSLRRRVDFRDYPYQDWPGREVERTTDFVLAYEDTTPKWLSDITREIPRLRVIARDVYIRWAITINAMHVAQDHYKAAGQKALQIWTQRADKDGKAREVILETWHAEDTAKNYVRATPALAAYALADLYGLIEEFIFEIYRIYLEENPMTIMKGQEFRTERRFFHERNKSDADAKRWQATWSERVDAWQRKRTYDGLHRVFVSFYEVAEFKAPTIYKHTGVRDWAQVIEAIGEARNLITHGVGRVSDKLESLTSKLKTNAFVFKSGELLDIDITHLMFVENFIFNLLTAISLSAFELKHGPLKDLT